MSYDPKFDAPLIPSVSEGARIIKQAIVIEVIDNPVLFKEDAFLDKLFETPQHCSHFNINEEALSVGASVFLNIVDNILEN